MAKKKAVLVDGLGEGDLKKLRSAIRLIWHRSYPRRLCLKRALTPEGFSKCEQCQEVVPQVTVDHLVPCGTLDGGFIDRMFCPSSGLQALCKKCHSVRTRAQRAKKTSSK